jgi:hypothetical protein
MNKITKHEAKYIISKNQKRPHLCIDCLYYGTNRMNNNNKCKKVEGYISKKGYCKLWKTIRIWGFD